MVKLVTSPLPVLRAIAHDSPSTIQTVASTASSIGPSHPHPPPTPSTNSSMVQSTPSTTQPTPSIDIIDTPSITSTITPAIATIVTHSSTPIVGSRLESLCLVNNVQVPVLFDTGSPTSLISRDLVRKHNWSTYSVKPLKWKGAIPGSTSLSTHAVCCTLLPAGSAGPITFSAYVSPDLSEQLIIGNPILSSHPSLLSSSKSTTQPSPVPGVSAIDTLVEDNSTLIDLYQDTIEEVFVVSLSATHPSSTFHLLPAAFQSEFSQTVSDVLPPHSGEPTYTHQITLKEGGKPPRLHPYRMTPKLEKECKLIIDDLLKKDFITDSKSPVSSPVLLVKKKDGTYRMVIDYRQLNNITIKDPFPLPRIDDLMAKIGDCSIFSTLDLHSGYYQIPMEPDSQPLTAFSTPFGHYEYKVMPFGLCNAPATFSRYMSQLLSDLPHVFVYLDDILIASRDTESHLQHLRSVLTRLKEAGLVCKSKKCVFLQESCEFLGFTIGKNGFSVQENKVKAVRDLPMPTTVKSCQSFMGLINYFRSFIPECSQLAKPLFDFISGKSSWTPEQVSAVKTLKDKLCNAPTLVPFVPGQKYRLTTDASYVAIGSVLERLHDNGQLFGVIGYFSKSVNNTQRNYPPGEIELLAIFESLEHFRYYLHGNHFILRTDHISLLSYRNKTEPSGRIARWLQKLAEYDFEIEHIKGKLNVVADALSRPCEVDVIQVFPLSELSTVNPIDWSSAWKKDPWSAAAMIKLGATNSTNISAANKSLFNKYLKKFKFSKKALERYTFSDGLLKYEDRICVPQTQRLNLLHTYHDSLLHGGHFGEVTTINKLLPLYYWPSMTKDIRKFVQTCLQCQLMKRYRHQANGPLHPLPVPEGRWIDISVDFITGLPTTKNGFDMIMVVCDRFSKRIHLIATKKTATSTDVIRLWYRYIFSYHGFPRTIVSDRDIRFTSGGYKELTERLGIKLLMSSSNHPQTAGQTESSNKTIGRLLRTFCSTDYDCWDIFLPHLEFVYNSTYQRAIRASPFEVDLGYIPNEPLLGTHNELDARRSAPVDMVKHLKAITLRTQDFLKHQQEAMENQVNPSRNLETFTVGDMVLLHRDAYFTGGRYLKIQPIFLGPFKIVKINENTCELDLPSSFRKHRTINIEHIKKFNNDPSRYPRELPNTPQEKILRAPEIISVVGYDLQDQFYYCKMQDVNPELVCCYNVAEFNTLPSSRRNSLLQNFKQLEGQV